MTTTRPTHGTLVGSTDKLRASQARVLAMFKLYGDLHDQALVTYLNDMEKAAGLPPMSPSGARTRRSELVKLGKLRETGQVVANGRHVTVWGLVP